MNSADTVILTNFYVSSSRPDNLFEGHYLNVRRKENRLYSDDELRALPEISKYHPHYKEWKVRKASCRRFVHYLELKKTRLDILEVGCGNGWMANNLAQVPGSYVIGSDINLVELQQAARVFSKKPRLKFIYGDIRSGRLSDMKFDIILFAASMQYFPSATEIINVSLSQLKHGGEIHILDSPFYKAAEIRGAKERSRCYFQSLGFPDMESYYFHHQMEALDLFNGKMLSNPKSIRNRIFSKNPFPWICIKND